MIKNKLQDAASVIMEGKNFLIMGHVNPDGDSLGCMCALGLALRSLGKSAEMVSPDGVPELYKFLPGSTRILKEVPPNWMFDAAIIVDCEGLDRLGNMAEILESCCNILEIDHHPGGKRGSASCLVDSSAASCGEILFEFLREIGVEITPDIADCLLTAIVTDTGSFRFSNVKSSTLHAAASLLEAGSSISKIAHKVYETRSLASVRLLGSVLSTLRTTANGRIAYASITRDQMALSQAVEAEAEGIVNYVRSVRGAKVGMLFREEENGNTRVSLRSKDGTDISQIARMFGGGGHKAAAGCTVDRPMTEAIDLVVDATRKWMG